MFASLLLLSAPAFAGSATLDEATFLSTWTDCPTDITADFEAVPLATYADEWYASEGLHLAASAYGALVDDDVAGSACRGTRCGRAPIEAGYGAEEPAWMRIGVDSPTDLLSFWVVDFGSAYTGEAATIVASLDGTEVDRFAFEPGGNDEDGGVFVGLSLAAAADTVLIYAQEAGDGFGLDDIRVPPSTCYDDDSDGMTEYIGDCDDADPTVFLGAPELCDGIDNDCDGVVPIEEGDSDFDTWMDCIDRDGDGVGYGDCAPEDSTTYPDAPELCDGIDNDCDGIVPIEEGDGDFDTWIDCIDRDGDGVGYGDCAPEDSTTYPDAPELCDGIDNDCDGIVPIEEGDSDFDTWVDCIDRDGDGIGYGDCAPDDPTTYPDAPELCDGIDNDCDGIVPDTELDGDKDGYFACEGDCDDRDPAVYPLATQLRNGHDDNCDGAVLGGTIGCSTVDTASGRLGLTALAILWAIGSRLRRRAPVLIGGVLLTGTAFAAFRDDLASYETDISSADYQREMAETNLGRQVVVQLNPTVFEEAIVSWLSEDPDRGRYQTTWRVALPYPWPGSQDFAADVWVTDVHVDVLDGEQFALTLSIDGYIDNTSTSRSPDRVGGDVVVTFSLAIDEDGGTSCPTGGQLQATSASVDTSALTVPGPAWLKTLASAAINNTIQAAFAGGPIEVYDLSALYGFGTDTLPDALGNASSTYDLDLCVHDARLRTVETPDNSDVGFVMVGVNVVDLAECYTDLESSGEYQLFTYTDEVFDAARSTIIPEGRDLALGISTGMMERVWWNLVWNMPIDQDGDGVGDTILWYFLRAVENDLAGKWFVTGYDYDRDTNWDGFATSRPIEDPVVSECDGWSYGEQVLDVSDMPFYPFFHTGYSMHLDHGLGCDSSAGFSADMRFDVGNDDYGDPSLFVELDADSYLHPSKWKGVLDVIDAVGGCGLADPIDDARKSLQNATAAVTAMNMARLFSIANESSNPSFGFDYLEARPAVLVFGGRVGTDFTRELATEAGWPSATLWSWPWAPAVGTIAGLNIDEPSDPVLADGRDPISGLCPLGYRRRTYGIGGATWTWCEFADSAAGVDPSTLPEGAWCGLDVHPRNQPELCDNVDNDGDGAVDEDFLDGDSDGLADCFTTLGGGDSDSGNDRYPTEYEALCGTYAPRSGCPAGFTQLPIWVDADYGACLLDPTSCTLADADVLSDADLVTCVADGRGYDSSYDDLLPEGLVRNAEIVGYSASASKTCSATIVDQETGYATGYYDATLGYWVRFGGKAGHLRYCAAEGNGGDDDADSLVAEQEGDFGSDATLRSSDDDVFSDGEEYLMGTSPTSTDSDGDGLSDVAERLALGTDPANADTDGDGLPDGFELWVLRYDPLDVDSDNDGIDDAEEEEIYDVDGSWFTWGVGLEVPPETEGEGVPDDGTPGSGS